MKKSLFLIFFLILFIFLITCITTFVAHSSNSFITSSTDYYFSPQEYSWPIPGYYTISSSFGLRVSPTTGASTYHTGIDIPAPEETYLYSCCAGQITYLDYERSQWLHFKNPKQQYAIFIFPHFT